MTVRDMIIKMIEEANCFYTTYDKDIVADTKGGGAILIKFDENEKFQYFYQITG